MDTYMNIKNSLTALVGGAILFIVSAMMGHTDWLMAALMIVGITLMGIGGAFFIRTTTMKKDNPNERNQWREFDFGQICQ